MRTFCSVCNGKLRVKVLHPGYPRYLSAAHASCLKLRNPWDSLNDVRYTPHKKG